MFLRILWFLFLAAVVIGSLAPAQSSVVGLIGQANVNDKVEHFSAYAILAAIPTLARFRRLGATMLSLLLLGGALELGQLLSPGRSCDWHDFLANACGILAGYVLARLGRGRADSTVFSGYRY